MAMSADAAPELSAHTEPPPAPSEPSAPVPSREMIPDAATTDTHRSPTPEDAMLARALDELEAILRGNRKAGSEN
jgi:hypothetical protein